MWLLIVALFGLLVPNGIFVYWLLRDYHGLGPVLSDRLALGFILDAMLAMILIAAHFAKSPPGRLPWWWFVLFSLIGGLGFSLPLYWWLNTRGAAKRT
jgi:hypothetical protein